jgi:hypothetical protein
VEVESQFEDVLTFSRQHANGEVFEAQNIEVARGMCPVLGKMSLEEAGLLLELEAIGKEQMADTPEGPEKIIDQKPVIERIETTVKTETKQGKQILLVERQPEATIEPVVHNNNDIIRKLLAEDMHDRFLAQQETFRAATTIATTTREAVPRPLGPESVLAANETAFLHKKVANRADDIFEVTHEAMLQSSDEQHYESIEGQLEPHVVLRNLDEVAVPTEMSKSLVEYDSLEKDDVISLMDGLEQSERLIEENEELSLVADGAYTPETKAFMFTHAEMQTVVSVPELPAPVEEIEVAITQLAEALELKEANASQDVYQILEEIITLPDALEASTVEAQAAVEEKLKVLFVRLFETTGIEHTPELIESFIKLTGAHYLEALLPRVAAEAEEDTGALHDVIGTREFLQKLQHGLSAMKQAVVHFYAIGKSVVRLYALASAVPQYTRAAD